MHMLELVTKEPRAASSWSKSLRLRMRRVFRGPFFYGVRVSFTETAGVVAVGAPWNLQGEVYLKGRERRKAAHVVQLLKAYGVVGAPHVMHTKWQGATVTSIDGLAFDDADHVALVVGVLAERCFPLSARGGVKAEPLLPSPPSPR